MIRKARRNRQIRSFLGAAAAVLAASIASPALAATDCAGLKGLGSSELTITRAEQVTALADVAPNLAAIKVPAFCRVAGYLSPTPDSHIGFEVWLPAGEAWNDKFQAVGNGGFFGFLNYRATAAGLQRGYATMTTDLGHLNKPGASEDATWALGHGDKVVDYAWRGEHLAVLAAKKIIAAYYGKAPVHAYYTGCSAGGIQGLTELLRYAADFDGYVIGDATPDHLAQEMGALWNTLKASLKYPDAALQPVQIALIHQEVLRQCAGKDGGLASDPFLTDPTACRFRAATLLCKPGQMAASCLSQAQVGIVDRIYSGPVNPRTGASILAGITPGGEGTWDRYFSGKTNPVTADRPWGGFLTYMAYGDPTYLSGMNYLKFDFDRDVAALRAREVGGETLGASWNSPNRDLDAFVKAGGKVIQYHGWDDPNIPALEAVKFRQSLIEAVAKRQRVSLKQAAAFVSAFHRLFMVPGMGHCTGGDGAWAFGQNGQAPQGLGPERDTMVALEAWVERGVAPERFIGARLDAKSGKVDLTRPICAYPKIPAYQGHGDTSDAANFACVERH